MSFCSGVLETSLLSEPFKEERCLPKDHWVSGGRGPEVSGAPDHLALIPMDMGAAAMDKAAPPQATELDLMAVFSKFLRCFQ